MAIAIIFDFRLERLKLFFIFKLPQYFLSGFEPIGPGAGYET